MVEKLLRVLSASTWLALWMVPAATAAEGQPPDITVSIEGSLPAPGTVDFAQFRFDNAGDLDATFNGDLRFEGGAPARVLGCEFSGDVPAHDISGAACTVESAAGACDQALALVAVFESAGGGEVRSDVIADFQGVGPCDASSSPPPTDTAAPPEAGGPQLVWFLAVAVMATAASVAVLRPRQR